MRENTKRFYRNSLFSILGFLLADAVMALSFQFDSSTPYTRIASAVIIAITAVGMVFYGYKVIKPLKSVWQTVLSVAVLPAAVLLIISVFLGFVFETNDIPAGLLILASNVFFNLLSVNPKLYDMDIVGNLILFLAPLLPFIYMSIGTAMHGQRVKGKL